LDPRVRRSQTRLHQALTELILEQGWEAISVREVCERAGVSRSTFYLHFGDLPALLVSGLDNLVEHLLDHLRRLPPERRPPFAFLQGALAHAAEARPWVRAVLSQRSGLLVQREFRRVMVDLMREELGHQGIVGPDLEFLSCFLAGALVELLLRWDRDPVPIEDLSRQFIRFAHATAGAALGTPVPDGTPGSVR
jgi:AcrR family transcriptional regulator